MTEFYDPFLYDLNIGPGSRVGALYLEEAQRGSGPILELGCGTGDVLLPLARAGFEVVGLDMSEAMLGKCRERILSEAPATADKIQLVKGKMESFLLGRKFAHVIIPNEGLLHLLNEQTLRSTLSNCYTHLEAGGRVTLDIPAFDVEYLGRYAGSAREYLRDRGRFPLRDGGAVQVWELTQYDQQSGLLSATFRYEFLDHSSVVVKTYYRRLLLCPRRPSEVALTLELAGFINIRVDKVAEEAHQAWIVRAMRG